ncbi:hypothetical protein B0G84_8678 [Paraburkholderia sp. BL8N3]|nr:hypothetical protein B0G84_8678 [Paraburkholderia sp. BL8N3]
MRNDSTVFVGLDAHKESITVAYAINSGEVELLGKIGTTKADIDRLTASVERAETSAWRPAEDAFERRLVAADAFPC